jgi:nitrogenase subunit NifH
MYNTLSHHMQNNIVLVPEQFGSRKDMSTEYAAFKLTHSVLKPTNQKKMHVGGIFCDLAKASDRVNHEIFKIKLHFMTFRKQLQNGSDHI